MGIRITNAIDINRPVEEVWTYVNDTANDTAWRGPYVKSLEKLTEGPTGPGTRFRGTRTGVGKLETYEMEITDYVENSRLGWKSVGAGNVFKENGAYVLQLIPGGTRFTIDGTIENEGLWRAIPGFVFRAIASGPANRVLRQLKANVEAA